jgi:hypothetical protein
VLDEVAAQAGGTLLAGYYERTGGRIGDLLRRPEVAAEFSNWHR